MQTDKRGFFKTLFLAVTGTIAGSVKAKGEKLQQQIKDAEDQVMRPLASVSASVTPSLSPSSTPSTSPSPSSTPSTSPTSSLTPSMSPTMTPTSSASPSSTPSAFPSLSPTSTPSISLSVTPSVSPPISLTPSASPSDTPSIPASVSPTSTPSISLSATPSISPSVSVTPSVSPSDTPSVPASVSPTSTPSISLSATPSVSPPASPSTTPSVTPSESVTPSISPSASPNVTPSPTPSMLLPVDLLYFDVKPAGNDAVLLSWATATETNNLGFEIQRTSNLNTFDKIGWVPGYGNSNTLRTYSYTDSAIRPNTTYYYRLKQIDSNGDTRLHEVKALTLSQTYAEFGEFFPNPAGEIFWLTVNVLQPARLNINFYDSDGRKQTDYTFSLKKGSNKLDISSKGWPDGTYIGQIILGDKVFFKRIVIK